MSRYLLDTNIVSELIKPRPSELLLAWMSDQPSEALFISTVTIAETAYGVIKLPEGRRKRQLQEWFEGPAGPQTLFHGRILAFDDRAALEWAQLMASSRQQGRTRSAIDTQIAAIGVSNGCRIVTANEAHFWGLDIFNPLNPSPD